MGKDTFNHNSKETINIVNSIYTIVNQLLQDADFNQVLQLRDRLNT